MSNLDKKTIINMENTARYQTRSKLNIAFSTADRESAVFVFNITKGSKPLLLSSENVTGHIALKHSDGSFVKDTLHFTEPDINGRLEYYIPNEMLKRQGTVTMQVFISEKGNSNVTVAERIVMFDIEKSIVSQISAETKLQYIVEYDELQAIIANRITDIEDKMANAEDYVSQLEQAREKGLTDIEMAKADNVKVLNDLADQRLEGINNKANEYSSKFDDDKQYMDDKHQAFKESVLNSEVVTQGESNEWQKYKLTEEDGNRISKEGLDLLNLDTGYYETWNAVNGPIDGTADTFEVNITTGSSGQKTIVANQSNLNKTFINTIHTDDQDTGWKELISLPIDEEVETKNSAEQRANETLTDANQYTNEKLSTQKKVLFEGNAKGMGTSINLSESHKNYKYLFVTFESPRGIDTVVNDNNLPNNNNIILTASNLTDEDGSTLKVYEAILTKESNTKFIISNEVFNNLKTGATGKDEEGSITVVRIEGWN